MTITLIPLDHFSGQKAITNKPGGDDVRKLAEIIRELQTEANVSEADIVALETLVNRGSVQVVTDEQITAATKTTVAFIAPADGEIVYVAAYPQVAAAAGESMTIDVKINGTTVLTAVVTLDDSTSTDVVAGTLAAAVAFSQGDKITIERAYTAGGGPTPMTDTAVSVGSRFSE